MLFLDPEQNGRHQCFGCFTQPSRPQGGGGFPEVPLGPAWSARHCGKSNSMPSPSRATADGSSCAIGCRLRWKPPRKTCGTGSAISLWSRCACPPGKEKMPPLALFRLACTTVRDAKDLQTEVTAQLFRAALEGTAPSLALLHPMLNRLRVDMARDGSTALLNHSRFALAKLILNRNRKENTMEITEQHDAKAEDAALPMRTAARCARRGPSQGT